MQDKQTSRRVEPGERKREEETKLNSAGGTELAARLQRRLDDSNLLVLLLAGDFLRPFHSLRSDEFSRVEFSELGSLGRLERLAWFCLAWLGLARLGLGLV